MMALKKGANALYIGVLAPFHPLSIISNDQFGFIQESHGKLLHAPFLIGFLSVELVLALAAHAPACARTIALESVDGQLTLAVPANHGGCVVVGCRYHITLRGN